MEVCRDLKIASQTVKCEMTNCVQTEKMIQSKCCRIIVYLYFTTPGQNDSLDRYKLVDLIDTSNELHTQIKEMEKAIRDKRDTLRLGEEEKYRLGLNMVRMC